MNDNTPSPLVKVFREFSDVQYAMTHGLQMLLELQGVPKETRQMVREYMSDVAVNLAGVIRDASATGFRLTPPEQPPEPPKPTQRTRDVGFGWDM